MDNYNYSDSDSDDSLVDNIDYYMDESDDEFIPKNLDELNLIFDLISNQHYYEYLTKQECDDLNKYQNDKKIITKNNKDKIFLKKIKYNCETIFKFFDYFSYKQNKENIYKIFLDNLNTPIPINFQKTLKIIICITLLFECDHLSWLCLYNYILLERENNNNIKIKDLIITILNLCNNENILKNDFFSSYEELLKEYKKIYIETYNNLNNDVVLIDGVFLMGKYKPISRNKNKYYGNDNYSIDIENIFYLILDTFKECKQKYKIDHNSVFNLIYFNKLVYSEIYYNDLKNKNNLIYTEYKTKKQIIDLKIKNKHSNTNYNYFNNYKENKNKNKKQNWRNNDNSKINKIVQIIF